MSFEGGDIASNSGTVPLRQADRLTGLTQKVSIQLAVATDDRIHGAQENQFLSYLLRSLLLPALHIITI